MSELGPFELASQGKDLPVFAWKLKECRHWSQYDLAERLRDRGWQVPAYSMPANRQDLVVQRAVVRNGFHRRSGGHAGSLHPAAPGLVRFTARVEGQSGGRVFPSLI